MTTRYTTLRLIPPGIWGLGGVSRLMDIPSELMHGLLPVFGVSTLGASAFSGSLRSTVMRRDRTARRSRSQGQRDPGEPEEPSLLRKHVLWRVGLGFIFLVLLSTMADLDLRLSRYFYDPEVPQTWFLKTAAPWIWLYRYGEFPTALLAVGAAVVWCGSWRWRAWVRYRRACALLVLVVTLGPGLLVNGVLKPLWGRPRPRQVEVFGGSRPYRHWWQPGHLGGGTSFPSGHAAMGYVLVVGTYLVPQRRSSWLRGLLLGGALTYGSLLGLTRIVQGGHFVSDVLWSGGLMCFTVAILRAVLPLTLPTDVDTQKDVHPPQAADTRG